MKKQKGERNFCLCLCLPVQCCCYAHVPDTVVVIVAILTTRRRSTVGQSIARSSWSRACHTGAVYCQEAEPPLAAVERHGLLACSGLVARCWLVDVLRTRLCKGLLASGGLPHSRLECKPHPRLSQHSLFGGATPSIEIVFGNTAGRACSSRASGVDGQTVASTYIFSNGEDIAGDVKVAVHGGKPINHIGIKVELKGVSVTRGEKGAATHEFVNIVKELSGPGSLSGLQALKFAFPRAELPQESYDGATATTRYFVRVTISRSGYASGGNIVKEADLIVQNLGQVNAMGVVARRVWREGGRGQLCTPALTL